MRKMVDCGSRHPTCRLLFSGNAGQSLQVRSDIPSSTINRNVLSYSCAAEAVAGLLKPSTPACSVECRVVWNVLRAEGPALARWAVPNGPFLKPFLLAKVGNLSHSCCSDPPLLWLPSPDMGYGLVPTSFGHAGMYNPIDLKRSRAHFDPSLSDSRRDSSLGR